jgi:hypothetical protein
MIVSASLATGCTAPKKIDVGGTCILNSDCGGSLVCTWGICHVACRASSDCQKGESCISVSDQSMVCQKPTACTYNSQCPTGLTCAVDQQCRKQCLTDVDCSYGQTCTTTSTCAELNQVDSNKDLLLPDGGLSGLGGMGGGGTGGSTNAAPDAAPDLPADLPANTGGTGGGAGRSGGTPGSGGATTVIPDASPDFPADVPGSTGGMGGSGGAPGTGGSISVIPDASPDFPADVPSSAGGGAGTTTGGTAPTGGTISTSTGGSPAIGVPVMVSMFDISRVSGTPGLRLGDINGDGKMEIVIGQPQATVDDYTPQQVVCVTAYDLKGKQLWQYGTPGSSHAASSDIPIQVYDLDGDGKSEVFAAMSATEITVIDGSAGTLLRKIPLPTAGSNDAIAFADLRGKGWPQDILVKTRYSQEWAITGIDDATTKSGTLLWNHKMLASDTGMSDLGTGHYPLAYDWDGDGKDEVMCGYDFLESDGTRQWSASSTSKPALTMYANAIATADVDGNPANGYEILVAGSHAAMFDWKTGAQYWQDNNTVQSQQLGVGEYRSDHAGLDVVLLDRIGPLTANGHDGNVLLSSTDQLIWKETRTDFGWQTVTENLNNWDGRGTDLILSYHRGGQTPATLYDGGGNVVAQFPHSGNLVDSAQHADLCGDGKEEVIVYNESTIWIFANGGCNLDDPPAHPSIPQQFHLYNWSAYSGWITPDVKFYSPGSKR